METIATNGFARVQVLQHGRNARTGARESQVSLILAERPNGSETRTCRTRAPLIDHRRLRRVIQSAYAQVALFPGRAHPWPLGATLAARLGYSASDLASLPVSAVESFTGVADPLPAAQIRPGEVVVDVGAGSGVDALLAARRAGMNGRVVGVELTEELLRKATLAARQARVGYASSSVSFRRGCAEDLPLPDASVDVVLANGVVNLLVADKRRALHEAWRVLKPEGRLVLSDVVVVEAAPWEERSQPERWVHGLAGPVPTGELVDLLHLVGFTKATIVDAGPVAVGSALVEAARRVGARRVVITARKNAAE